MTFCILFWFNPLTLWPHTTSALILSVFHIILLWLLTTLVSSGAITCVFVSLLCPAGKCVHSQGRVDKSLWAHGCNVQNIWGTITLYYNVGCFLNCFSLCWVFIASNLQFWVCSALFPSVIHVLKRAKSSVNPQFLLEQPNRGRSSTSL